MSKRAAWAWRCRRTNSRSCLTAQETRAWRSIQISATIQPAGVSACSTTRVTALHSWLRAIAPLNSTYGKRGHPAEARQCSLLPRRHGSRHDEFPLAAKPSWCPESGISITKLAVILSERAPNVFQFGGGESKNLRLFFDEPQTHHTSEDCSCLVYPLTQLLAPFAMRG